MRHAILLLAALLTTSVAQPQIGRAEIRDPLDPLSPYGETADLIEDDETKSSETLVGEAEALLKDDRPLDARTKLLRALQKDPKRYDAHVLLAGYYLVHVGHFRLALRYIKQAQQLFEEQHGKAPYSNPILQMDHARMLYFLAQIRLDLDNYEGALEILDQYASYGYMATWYPSSRAWVLMKLGKIEEAIRVARIGIMQLGFITDGAPDRGRIYNMLGILLSMHGEEQNSLDVFREAIAYEQSLGTDGQPATPLNNSGEVYRELFDEERAESQWIRATSSHDGCEHVLPSLNLALLYIEQANFQAAKRAMDSFASCVAQYPLRNGEEHRALVHLIRGRLQLHTGHVEKAIKHFEEALADRQWFGKIGTSEEDLRAATMTSLAQALQRANERQAFRVGGGIGGWFDTVAARSKRTVSTWWYFRRARQILSEQLNRFEDIQIRNTDSMLEYPTLGDLLSTIPTDVLERRLAYERESDRRPEAHVFYDAYLAQNLLSQGDVARATRLLNRVSTSVRPRADELLRVQTMLQKLKLLAPGSAEYAAIAGDVFSTVRAALPSAGLRLPVNYQGSAPSLLSTLRESAFYLDNSRQYDHTVSAAIESGEFVLEFSAVNRSSGSVKVRGNDLHETVNKFTDEVFAIELQ